MGGNKCKQKLADFVYWIFKIEVVEAMLWLVKRVYFILTHPVYRFKVCVCTGLLSAEFSTVNADRIG